MHADLQAWEQAVSSRDTELRNLQVGTIQVLAPLAPPPLPLPPLLPLPPPPLFLPLPLSLSYPEMHRDLKLGSRLLAELHWHLGAQDCTQPVLTLFPHQLKVRVAVRVSKRMISLIVRCF